MAAAHAFLDILAHMPLRDAYLAGRITLVLTPDLATVLWANGAGARFMGYATVAESLEAQGGFAAESRAAIRKALASNAAVSVSAAGHAQSFLADKLILPPWGEVVFLRSVAAAVSGSGLVDLTEGLSDESSEAALLDISAQIMHADSSFNTAIIREPALRPLLEEAFHDGGVKKRLLGGDRPYPVGVLRLNKEPPVFLLIAARQKPAASAAAAAADAPAEHKARQPAERAARGLNQEERQAFHIIARHLRQGLGLSGETAPGNAAAAADNAAAAKAEADMPGAEASAADAGKAGAVLPEQKDRRDFLLSSITEALVVMDNAGIIRSANVAAGKIFGSALAAFSGQPAENLFAPAAAAALRAELGQARAMPRGAFLNPGREAEGRMADGRPLKLRLNFGCLPAEEGYFLLMRDMTRFHDIIAALLRKNQAEAEAKALQGRTLALISHEIRAPLNAILGMAQFIEAEKAGALGSGKYKEYLGDIIQAGRHILSLVNDILQTAKDETDWLQADKQPLSLFQVLNEALALMIPQANAADILIRSAVAADLPPVLADARAVKQILLNIIGNAAHFTPAGGQIVISAHELRESAEAAASGAAVRHILLRISDTGIGMSAAEIARVLRKPPDLAEKTAEQPPKAAENAAADNEAADNLDSALAAFRRRGRGAGLGLPIAAALAEANGLRFSLASELGKGTIAALVFPVAGADKA